MPETYIPPDKKNKGNGTIRWRPVILGLGVMLIFAGGYALYLGYENVAIAAITGIVGVVIKIVDD